MKKDFLYKTAEKVWECFIRRDRSGTWYTGQVKENLKRLHPFAGKDREKVYYIQKVRLSMLICLAGFLLAGGLGLSERLQSSVEENRIFRRGYGEGTKKVPLEVWADGKKRYELDITVGERKYGKEQLKELYEGARKELEEAILGENVCLDYVEKDLTLVDRLSGYPFRIEWESTDYSLIDGTGRLQGENLSEEGVPVSLKAVFLYEDFRAEYLLYLQIFPETLTEEERRKRELFKAVEIAEEESREEETLLLPSESDGEKLLWRGKQDKAWLFIFPATMCVAVIVYFLKDEDLKKEIKKREEQMLLTYPEVVSKLSVYLGAGITLKTAWEKMCADYERGKTEKGSNAVYEEMNIACQEMKSGVSELKAYEQFGRRCGLQLYSKFSALLIQNLKKGSTKLGPLLKEESRRAFEERKNAARKAGEEAGTKLLLPMMMMLCVVMVMILLPAFMAF